MQPYAAVVSIGNDYYCEANRSAFGFDGQTTDLESGIGGELLATSVRIVWHYGCVP